MQYIAVVRYDTIRHGTVQYRTLLHCPIMNVCCHFVAAASRERERGGRRGRDREKEYKIEIDRLIGR